jgi:hypothetical protein
MKWFLVLLYVLFGSAFSISATLVTTPVSDADLALPANIQILCTTSYKASACHEHARSLAAHLRRFPLDRLGGWRFILVPSSEWNSLMATISGNSASPAFSLLQSKVIVLEEALFGPVAPRQRELMDAFGETREKLLDLAISHEFGHAICMDVDEGRARRFGKLLRAGAYPSCQRTREQMGTLVEFEYFHRPEVRADAKGARYPHK